MTPILKRSTSIIGLAAALAVAVAPAAQAVPETAATTSPAGPTAETDSSAMQDYDRGVTVGSARNQATGDVLGLGYEQVIRIEGSAVVVAEPQWRGGAELRRFEAGLSTSWSITKDVERYDGQSILEKVIKHDASRIAVLGNHIYVSRLYEFKHPNGSRWDSEVSKYTADGVFQTRRTFEGRAVTALDAYRHDNKDYLAIGLNLDGVVVAHADGFQLPDFRLVHEDWTGRGLTSLRDQVTVVKLGTDETGRLMLVAGKITSLHPAIVATDLRAGESGTKAGVHMWSNNWRPYEDTQTAGQFPDLLAFGKLGPNGRQMVAISWPQLGRITFLDAETGQDWVSMGKPTGAHAVRFFTGRDGGRYVAIGRDFDQQVGYEGFAIGTANENNEWVPVMEGKREGLAGVLAHFTFEPPEEE